MKLHVFGDIIHGSPNSVHLLPVHLTWLATPVLTVNVCIMQSNKAEYEAKGMVASNASPLNALLQLSCLGQVQARYRRCNHTSVSMSCQLNSYWCFKCCGQSRSTTRRKAKAVVSSALCDVDSREREGRGGDAVNNGNRLYARSYRRSEWAHNAALAGQGQPRHTIRIPVIAEGTHSKFR
eukprot:643071-Pleurochrysis_carterae.AAC.1